MKKPNLFIVGHPKTGTSSLYDYLAGHPEVHMSAIKEPYFVAKDFHSESDCFHNRKKHFPFRTEKKYMKLYKTWEGEKVMGEASALNLYSKASAKEILHFNPNAKILLMLREPVDFLYSYHSTAIFSLGEHIIDFERALAIEEERKMGEFLSKRVIVPSWLFYSELIKYNEQVTRFMRDFSGKQMRIMLFDDFKRDTPMAFREVLDFLEVDPDYTPEFKVVNANKKVKWPRIKYLLESPVLYGISRFLLSPESYAKLVRYYKDMMVTYQPRPELDKKVRVALMKKFKPEVEKISKLLERDLVSLWKYSEL